MYFRMYSRRSSALRIAAYFRWFNSSHPPSICSIRRPSFSFVRLYGSGAKKHARPASVSSIDRFARLASPGTLPCTSPAAFAIASIVTHNQRVATGSLTIVDSVIEEKSFVYESDTYSPEVCFR